MYTIYCKRCGLVFKYYFHTICFKKPQLFASEKYLIYVSVVSLQVNYANTLNRFAFCGADRVLRYVPAGVSMHTYSTPIGIQLNVPKC